MHLRVDLKAFPSILQYCSHQRLFPPNSESYILFQTFLRDKMLNDYIHKKEQLGAVMKNIDEVIKLKR